MTFSSPEFETVETKNLDDTHELLKLRDKRGILALILAAKEASSGAIFGGHNWEEIGRHPAVIDDYFKQIGSQADFMTISVKVRNNMQSLIEEHKI